MMDAGWLSFVSFLVFLVLVSGGHVEASSHVIEVGKGSSKKVTMCSRS